MLVDDVAFSPALFCADELFCVLAEEESSEKSKSLIQRADRYAAALRHARRQISLSPRFTSLYTVCSSLSLPRLICKGDGSCGKHCRRSHSVTSQSFFLLHSVFPPASSVSDAPIVSVFPAVLVSSISVAPVACVSNFTVACTPVVSVPSVLSTATMTAYVTLDMLPPDVFPMRWNRRFRRLLPFCFH